MKGITDELGHPLYRSAPKQLDKMWEERLADNFPKKWANASPLEVNYKLHGISKPMQGRQIVRALEEPDLVSRAIDHQNQLPHQIHFGWSKKGPEHDSD